MSAVKTDSKHYTDIAEAIRSKTGGTATYKPSEMAAAISGITGGGGNLNFAVVGGTTQPENPSANTVWVDTDVEITGWVFSNDEPSSPPEGMIWFGIAAYGNGFNALDENGLYVYPISAKQYIDSAWVIKSMLLYDGAEWLSTFNGYFCTGGDITEAFEPTTYLSPDTTSVVFGDTAIECATVRSVRSEAFVVFGPVDLTDYDTLNVSGTIVNCNTYAVIPSIFVAQNAVSSYADAVAIKNNQITCSSAAHAFSFSLDVSELSGAYYVYAGTHTGTSAWNMARTVHVQNLWLE